MRIGNVEVNGPNEEVLVLPRLSGDIVIKARAVTSMLDFDKFVAEPKPPTVLTKDGAKPNEKDITYKQKMETYGNQRFAFLVLKSLEPSNIGWTKVNIEQPDTWLCWDEELREAGLADIEINRIIMCVMQANSLDEAKLVEARKVFLLGKAAEVSESSGLPTERGSTPSGEPANV